MSFLFMKRPAEFIANKFFTNPGDFDNLCQMIGEQPANIFGNTPSERANRLEQNAIVKGRLGDLLFAIQQFEVLAQQFDPSLYLYLLLENTHALEDDTAVMLDNICQDLQLDCQELRVNEWGNPRPIKDRTKMLQQQMEERDELDKLFFVYAKYAPSSINLKAFEGKFGKPTQQKPVKKRQNQGKQQAQSAKQPATRPFERNPYENFDIRIRRPLADGRYPIEVTRNPLEIEMFDDELATFPTDDQTIKNVLSSLKLLAGDKEKVKDLGQKMRDALFYGEIWNIFYSNLVNMKQQNKGLRIRLRVDPAELSGWPWEYCFYDHPDFGFFTLDPDTPIVRYIPGSFPAQSPPIPGKLKVLVATSEPSDQNTLSIEKELKVITTILDLMGDRVELKVLRRATYERVQGALADQPHIFHFIGHGVLRGGQGALVFENKHGESDFITHDELRNAFKGNEVKIAILNACESAAQGVRSAFTGVAQSLVKAEIPAVIAMQYSVYDQTALGFTRDLYRFLMAGYPLDTAVTKMRQGAYRNDTFHWGIPVLFMRAPDGVLWQPSEEIDQLFEANRDELANISIDENLSELLAEVKKLVTRLADDEDIDPRDEKYINRGLDDAINALNEPEPDMDSAEKSLTRVIEDIKDTNSDIAIKETVGKVQHILDLAREKHNTSAN